MNIRLHIIQLVNLLKMSTLGALAESFGTIFGTARANLDGVDSEAVISSRDVVKAGWLSKQSRNVKEWRKRYIVLTKDCEFESC